MKVGVLSDTHLHEPEQADRLADRLLSGPFAGVAAIIHAGDSVLPDLDMYFDSLPWYSVRGNMDHSSAELPISRIFMLAKRRIGLIHGWGPAEGLDGRVVEHFSGQDLDVIIFGHSHMPLCRYENGILLFNPGSATDRRRAPFRSVGLLHLDVELSAEIVSLD